MGEGGIFLSATFEEAVAQANAKGAWLIVWATSARSEPAALMERATWQAGLVAKRLTEKDMLAVRVDVDDDPELAVALKIRSAPTILAFKDGEEKDRLTGFRDPAHVLMWLLGLGGEKTPFDQVIHAGTGDLEQDMQARLSLAKALLHDQRYDDATQHYVWLWHNITRVEPDMSGVRVSFMAGEIATLVAAHAPARAAFTAIRDAAGVAADADPSSEDLRHDWVVLNKLLADDDRTLAWFDGIKPGPSWQDTARRGGRDLMEILKARGRLADIGRLYRNPLKELEFLHSTVADHSPGLMSEMFGKEMFATVQKVAMTHFRTSVGELYASLRAAGRDAEADQVHAEALRLDASDEMKQALGVSPARYD
jgi:hypothetical protein